MLVGSSPAVLHGQDEVSVRQQYFHALAEFFEIPAAEVSILGEWRLEAEEIPVVLFVARRAGVSAEALVALRRSGRPWSELVGRYQLDAGHFYVPLDGPASAGRLRRVYEAYAALPASRWREVVLDDRDIVWLVNLRVVAQTLRMPPRDVLRAAGEAASWVDVYADLLRRPDHPPERRVRR